MQGDSRGRPGQRQLTSSATTAASFPLVAIEALNHRFQHPVGVELFKVYGVPSMM
jgi:hypothetical protein